MSEEQTTLFTPATMQTFMAAGFVAALLAMAIAIYGTTRVVAHATVPHNTAAPAPAPDHSADIQAMKASIKALQAKVTALEAAKAAPAEAPE